VREEDPFGFEEDEKIPKFANQDVLTIDVSEFESEGRKESELVAVSLDALIHYIRDMLASEDQIPLFLFEQYEKWLDKKPIYSYTRDLFSAYKDSMEKLYEKFGFSGFMDDFNDYILDRDKEKKDVKVEKVALNPVVVSALVPDVIEVAVNDGVEVEVDF